MTKLRAAALSDIGKIRRTNEDRALLDEKRGVFGVADGVGGLPGGEVASQAAHDAVLAAIRSLPEGVSPDLAAIVAQANRSVVEKGREIAPSTGIATTLTFGCIVGNELRIAHLGDSRCYGWTEGRFALLTEDHTVESEARRKGDFGDFVPFSMAERHAITRCLGHPKLPEPYLISHRLAPGERFLFCTDGVTGLVDDPEIAAMTRKKAEPAAILSELIGLALKRGGTDNATAVLVIVDEA